MGRHDTDPKLKVASSKLLPWSDLTIPGHAEPALEAVSDTEEPRGPRYCALDDRVLLLLDVIMHGRWVPCNAASTIQNHLILVFLSEARSGSWR